ncbi:MAG TPA: hypothetical protein DHN33_08290 [Eubacteriaceae bacterium]|nr:hypothetical protein [Eubacteriaceae bacterium]
MIGTQGLFLEAMIAKLNKEAQEVFVLDGKGSKTKQKHPGVMEEYHFGYDSENIEDIFNSINPDVVVFTGALDPTFTWKQQRDSVHYSAGLNNILISANKSGVKRLIYLSTTDVYDPMQFGYINEQSPTNPKGQREKTILNGEETVLAYGRDENLDVVILRSSDVYGYYKGYYNEHCRCSEIAKQVLEGESVYVDKGKKYDFLHVTDLVQLIFQVTQIDQLAHEKYNICYGRSYSEEEVFNRINEVLGKEQDVKYINDTQLGESELVNERAKKELNFSIKYTFEENFEEMVEDFKRSHIIRTKGKKGFRWLIRARESAEETFGWFFPYFETIIGFLIIHFLVFTTYGSSYLRTIDFYLLFVVLIAIVYGKGQTIIALLLSFASRVYIESMQTSVFDIAVDYNTYIWMLQLLIIGMGVGYIRDQYRQTIDDKEEVIEYLDGELEEIKEINHSNIRIKKIFENRLINYKDSFARIYDITSQLNDLEPDQIVFAAIDVLEKTMNAREVSIYRVDANRKYARLMAASEDIHNAKAKSVELSSWAKVFETIETKEVFINRTLEETMPALAGGVYYKDELQAIVIIDHLDFENTSFYHANLFSVVLDLIAQSISRANQYIEESSVTRYLPNTNILTSKSFEKILDIKKNASEKHIADYHMLQIEKKNRSLQELSELLSPTMRQQDYLGIDESENLYLLLTNTNKDEATVVVRRLSEKGIAVREEVRT